MIFLLSVVQAFKRAKLGRVSCVCESSVGVYTGLKNLMDFNLLCRFMRPGRRNELKGIKKGRVIKLCEIDCRRSWGD